MISRKLLKTEIDNVRSEYLGLLYSIIKLFEKGPYEGLTSAVAEAGTAKVGPDLDWRDFVAKTYGCLAETPISREEQGHYENREAME